MRIEREREREVGRQRKPQEVAKVACLKFAIKVSQRQTRTCVSFVFMQRTPSLSRFPLFRSLALPLPTPLSLTSGMADGECV